MSNSLLHFGPHSPLQGEDRETVEAVFEAVRRSANAKSIALAESIERHVFCLESMGELLTQYPNPFADQKLGGRERGLNSLIENLSRTNPFNFEFHVPTRALIGRTMDMAETNFYRLLWHICGEVLDGEESTRLREATADRLRSCLYTKLAEEVLTGIASDDQIELDVRQCAMAALAYLWGQRLTYRVTQFFPVLEATWEARQKIKVTGGTLLGAQEIFELFREGCDPRFVEYFTRTDPSDDELQAFREFLFGASAEELNRLALEMDEQGASSVSLDKKRTDALYDSGTVFYEFFRSRFVLATARRMANLPGPKRTAEGYVMINILSQSVERAGEEEAARYDEPES